MNNITSLDFDPNGKVIALFDREGICLVSDVNTNNCKLHIKLRGGMICLHFLHLVFLPVVVMISFSGNK